MQFKTDFLSFWRMVPIYLPDNILELFSLLAEDR